MTGNYAPDEVDYVVPLMEAAREDHQRERDGNRVRAWIIVGRLRASEEEAASNLERAQQIRADAEVLKRTLKRAEGRG